MIDQPKPLLIQSVCKHGSLKRRKRHSKGGVVAAALLQLNHDPVAIATGATIEDLACEEVLKDECHCIVWVRDQPQTTWYIYEQETAPTWRLWGEEKCEGAIHTVYLKKVRYHHPSRSITQESDDDEISHLEWETVRVRFLKAGTLERLIESLTSDSGELESSFVNVFLATYRTFATTNQVLNRMLDRYITFAKANQNSVCLGIPPHLHEHHKKAIRLTLQVWLDTCTEDFRDPPLFASLHQILDFTKEYLPDSDFLIKVNYKLEKMKREEEMKNSPLLERILSLDDLTISCNPCRLTNGVSHPNISLCPPYEFHNIPEDVFAQQLTRMDAILFQRLIPHQCLGSVWSQRDKAKGNASPTVVATIEQFNAVIYRVQSTVLVDTDLKPSQRAKLITKWIDVAQELRMLKNFSSLKAIISSLQSNPIYRLRKTWGAVCKEKAELYSELARIFSDENNKLNQRELLIKEGTAKHAQAAHADDRHLPKAIEKLNTNPLAVNHGTIPYLGTFLTDLTMIDTAIPDTVENNLINFDKKRKEFEVLAQIRLLQGAANAYHFENEERFERWWDSVLVLEVKEVFDLSCQIEAEGNSAPSSVKSSRTRSLSHCKNNSLGENSIVSSNDSFVISQESYLSERKLSTSSNSSLPSVNMSIHSSGASISPSTPEKNQRLSDTNSSHDSPLQSAVSLSPYITQDYYIIKVSVESSSHETEGVNLYKSIFLNNSERTLSVIEKAMAKHDINGDPKDFSLVQIISDGEIVLPPSANVYYAIKLEEELKFMLRRRRYDDENRTVRRAAAGGKDFKVVRKKILTLKT